MSDKYTESPEASPNIKRRYRSRAEWKTLIDNYPSSGLTQKKYCQKNNISMSGFYNWSSTFKKEAAQPQASDLVELVPDRSLLPSPNTVIEAEENHSRASSWRIELSVSDTIVLRIR